MVWKQDHYTIYTVVHIVVQLLHMVITTVADVG